MKYLPINRDLFIKNRAKFIAQMAPKSIAVFNSNDIYPISADSTVPFKQHRDIFHLSGVDQEESILVLFPDAHENHYKEVLFLKETSELIAIWEGEKLTKETAFETAGIKSVFWLQDFDVQFNNMMAQAENVYINTNEHTRANTEVQTREDRFIESLQKKYPAHNYKKSAPIMHRIRSVKDPIEIDLMQQACNITAKGVQRVIDFMAPGVWEYEIEAEILHEFIRNRANGFAYTPIIGSGYNACVLHYIENNQQCKAGDVVLMDFGAEYANYSSDLTRCFPVSGKFTQRQKAVYDAVHRVKTASQKLLVPGTYMVDYHKEVGKLMESELLG
ncbi:MAG: aminopeptidase P N-terminal domain-containing protein, partial [Salibacteraceae bacterium]